MSSESGSAGNSAVVRSDAATFLVDAGMSAKQLCLRLEQVGVDPDSLDGVVLTHEHGDHTRGLDVFCRKRKLDIFCNIRTREVLRHKIESEVSWRLFESGDSFPIGDVGVQSFYIPHDAVEPMGFVFRQDSGSFGLVSDIGHPTTLVKDHLKGVDSLFVEANYDDMMLQNDTKRPWSTKQRISSRHGHLSNDQAAELVEAVAGEKLHQVVLGHLSRDCNAPNVALAAIQDRLVTNGWRDVDVQVATQNEIIPFRPVVRGALCNSDLPDEDPLILPRDVGLDEELSVPPLPDRSPPNRQPVQAWSASQLSLFD